MKKVYFDNHSNTVIDEEVLNEMMPYLKESYGNAQSMHTLGQKSKDAIEKAREQAAVLIGANASEIYFTSSASEANNLAVKGAAKAYHSKGKHIIVSSIEHFSVLYSAKRLSQEGFEVTYIEVDKNGTILIEDLKKAIRPDTILVSVQHANTEIGTIQPINDISEILKSKGILFHTDAVGTVGSLPIDVSHLGVDFLTFSGAQFYGPKGAAVLFIKKGVKIIPQIDGGIQENGRRAGSENVAAIAGLGKACETAKVKLSENYDKIKALRDIIINELPKRVEYTYLNGHKTERLANNVNYSVEFIEGEGMLLLLDQKGIYVSSGSACASKALKMSHVLSALKLDTAVAQGSLTLTLSKYTTEEDISYFLEEFPKVIKKLREMSPLYNYFLKTGQRHKAGPGTDYEHEHNHADEDDDGGKQ